MKLHQMTQYYCRCPLCSEETLNCATQRIYAVANRDPREGPVSGLNFPFFHILYSRPDIRVPLFLYNRYDEIAIRVN
jgi:hypothetical protein